MSGYSKIDVLAAQNGKSSDEFVLALLNKHKNAAVVAKKLEMDRQTLYSWLRRRGYQKNVQVVWTKAE